MATAFHPFPKAMHQLGTKTTSLTADTLKVLLCGTGTYSWNSTSQAVEFVQDFLNGDGTHGALSELSSGSGYTTGGATLSTVSISQSTVYETLVVGTNPAWSSATFTMQFALFYDSTVGAGYASNPALCYWDFGSGQALTGGTFTLTIPTANGVSSALLQWTAN